MNVGYSPRAFGASRDEMVASASASLGAAWRDDLYSWLYLQSAGRYGSGQIRDGFATAEGSRASDERKGE